MHGSQCFSNFHLPGKQSVSRKTFRVSAYFTALCIECLYMLHVPSWGESDMRHGPETTTQAIQSRCKTATATQ